MPKSFSQSFEELEKCSQNISCGQCDVSKCLVCRHILKLIVKELKEKKQKKIENLINFMSSHAICHADPPVVSKIY